MQIKTTVRYHFISSRVTVTKNSENDRCWEDVEKPDPSYIADGNVTWCDHFGKKSDNFS